MEVGGKYTFRGVPRGAGGGGFGFDMTDPFARWSGEDAGLLAIQAIGLWARTPLDVVLTFGISPDGAWSPAAPGHPTATSGGVG